jgi:uncharacterized protein (DUF697 family)
MAKSRKAKPSFDAPVAATSDAPAWAYRTENPAPAPPAADSVPTQPHETAPVTARARGANALIERYATYSAAAGLVPVPAVDAAAIAAVQVKMLRALAAHYDVPFSQERGKSLIAAVLGGLMPSLAGVIGISGFAMTSTWAVGHVFVAHFETGGTLLDVNIEQSKARVSAALSRS